jgi:mRNA-degrading endonuclease toxin of MazEF toxin-antitoxin module
MRDRNVGTTDVKQGEIYWVDVPPPPDTIGSEQYSRRPYLIVSCTNANRANNTVVGIPFSASEKLLNTPNPQPSYRILVPAREIIKDLLFHGEIKDCIAKTDQIRVLDKTRLEKRIGRLSDTALASVGLGVEYLFDL